MNAKYINNKLIYVGIFLSLVFFGCAPRRADPDSIIYFLSGGSVTGEIASMIVGAGSTTNSTTDSPVVLVIRDFNHASPRILEFARTHDLHEGVAYLRSDTDEYSYSKITEVDLHMSNKEIGKWLRERDGISVFTNESYPDSRKYDAIIIGK